MQQGNQTAALSPAGGEYSQECAGLGRCTTEQVIIRRGQRCQRLRKGSFSALPLPGGAGLMPPDAEFRDFGPDSRGQAGEGTVSFASPCGTRTIIVTDRHQRNTVISFHDLGPHRGKRKTRGRLQIQQSTPRNIFCCLIYNGLIIYTHAYNTII